MSSRIKTPKNFAFDDLSTLQPAATKSVRRVKSREIAALDLAEASSSDAQKLLHKPNLTDPLPARPGQTPLHTRHTDVEGPLVEARGHLGENPAAARFILSSAQRATGAVADYRVDLTAAVASQLKLEALDASGAPLGAVHLSMSHRDGLDLQIERLDVLLEAVGDAGTFLSNMQAPDLRARYITANAAPSVGETRSPQAQAEAVIEAKEGLEAQREGMRDNVAAFYREAVDLIYDVSRGFEAASFMATAQSMLRAGTPLTPQAMQKIQADQQALQWPHLPALLPKFFAAYAQTFSSPAGAMLAVHAWRNEMLGRAHKITGPYANF